MKTLFVLVALLVAALPAQANPLRLRAAIAGCGTAAVQETVAVQHVAVAEACVQPAFVQPLALQPAYAQSLAVQSYGGIGFGSRFNRLGVGAGLGFVDPFLGVGFGRRAFIGTGIRGRGLGVGVRGTGVRFRRR